MHRCSLQRLGILEFRLIRRFPHRPSRRKKVAIRTDEHYSFEFQPLESVHRCDRHTTGLSVVALAFDRDD